MPIRNAAIALLVLVAALAASVPGGAAPGDRRQSLPDPMLTNVFALTQAATALRICANSDAFATLPSRKKALLARLNGKIDAMVRKIAGYFDDSLFSFYKARRDEMAGNAQEIADARARYGPCGDTLFKRMQWYVYDSRRKLDAFLPELPAAKQPK